MLKSHALQLHPAQDVKPPFVQCVSALCTPPLISHLVAISVIRQENYTGFGIISVSGIHWESWNSSPADKGGPPTVMPLFCWKCFSSFPSHPEKMAVLLYALPSCCLSLPLLSCCYPQLHLPLLHHNTLHDSPQTYPACSFHRAFAFTFLLPFFQVPTRLISLSFPVSVPVMLYQREFPWQPYMQERHPWDSLPPIPCSTFQHGAVISWPMK